MTEVKWARRAKDRPEEIYQAALKVFGSQGYRATKLDEVAAAAGISKGLIYRYFQNKEDLLRKALAAKMETLKTIKEQLVRPPQQSSAEFLFELCSQSWNYWQSEDWGNLYKLLLGEIAREIPDLYQAWIQGVWQQLRLIYAQVIQEGQKQGEFNQDIHAEDTARFLILGLSHALYLQAHKGIEQWDPWDDQRYFQNSVQLILKGLAKETQK